MSPKFLDFSSPTLEYVLCPILRTLSQSNIADVPLIHHLEEYDYAKFCYQV